MTRTSRRWLPSRMSPATERIGCHQLLHSPLTQPLHWKRMPRHGDAIRKKVQQRGVHGAFQEQERWLLALSRFLTYRDCERRLRFASAAAFCLADDRVGGRFGRAIHPERPRTENGSCGGPRNYGTPVNLPMGETSHHSQIRALSQWASRTTARQRDNTAS